MKRIIIAAVLTGIVALSSAGCYMGGKTPIGTPYPANCATATGMHQCPPSP